VVRSAHLPKRRPRDKDYRDLLLDEHQGSRAADHDERGSGAQRFGKRSKYRQQNKTLRTATDRLADARLAAQKKALPLGEVVQVHSLYLSVEGPGGLALCTSRRTMRQVIKAELGELCVGDRVRFRLTGGTANLTESETLDGTARQLPEGVIEAVEPRATVLMRADSFDANRLDPIVANATQFMIVVSMHDPFPRWGLVDRMLVAAQTGGLSPIIVVNKADLRDQADDPAGTDAALAHYERLRIKTVLASVKTSAGLDELRQIIREETTVLAGHSGVGKSSLASALDERLDLRVGVTSEAHQKGRHTTTSARRYDLSSGGGRIIDTPGIKVFAPVGVSAEELDRFFPDVAAGTAPDFRVENFERIRESLEAPAER